jgi:hypothetical protein
MLPIIMLTATLDSERTSGLEAGADLRVNNARTAAPLAATFPWRSREAAARTHGTTRDQQLPRERLCLLRMRTVRRGANVIASRTRR